MADVERAPDESTFFAAPHGRYLAAEGALFWCHSPLLWGVTLWDSLTDASVARLIEWIDEEHRHDVAPYVTALDFKRVRGVEGDAFARWQAWYPQNRERQQRRVLRAAIVRPDGGLVAPVVAGIPTVVAPRIPWTVSVDLGAALAWLEIPSPDEVALALDAMYDAAASRPPVIDALRAMLDRNLRAVTPDAVASSLGLSVRSLQRQLQAAGTSYDVEVQTARIRLAQRLLAESDRKLGAVAIEAGFATQAHFNAVFRRLTGETPGAWRRRVRGGADDD
jgi:AraC-like DNA-binding protein